MARSSRRDTHDDQDRGGDALMFALGAAGGLALGLLFARSVPIEPVREAGARLRERARDVATTFGPGRLRRAVGEEDALAALEDSVLDAFLRDPVLSERGIDVGCISEGIIELSGSVHSAEEGERAVRLVRTLEGVETVVNRMDVDRAGHERWEGHMAGEWTGRQVGMGQRRQSEETDPGADDSQHLREVALEQSDRAQYEDEEIAHSQPRMGARTGVGDVNPTNYEEDELDNQSPYGKHAVPAPEQPQALNSQARVGEGTAPGLELEMERADVPVKPHSDGWEAGRTRDEDVG
ncbi:MAG TPA: BON domain-containing protein [Longimicrobium sp.]|nr:BON domain-containing protein [Longimicrobium sp.]